MYWIGICECAITGLFSIRDTCLNELTIYCKYSSVTRTLLGELIHQYKHLSYGIQNLDVVVNIHKHWLLLQSTILKAPILQRTFGWWCNWCWQDSTVGL